MKKFFTRHASIAKNSTDTTKPSTAERKELRQIVEDVHNYKTFRDGPPFPSVPELTSKMHWINKVFGI